MKRQVVKLILVTAMILLLGGQSDYANAIQDWRFDLLPAGGNVSGPAGSTVGWGYTITNLDSDYYLELTSISADLFLNGDPLELFDFPTVAPGASVSVPFDGINGLYQLTWYPAAPVGFVNSGTFILSADWWEFIDNALIFVETASDKSAEYSATVSPAAVPEPSTWLLLVSALPGIVVLNTIMLRGRETKAAEGQT